VNDLLKVVYFAERMMIEFDKMVVVYFAERLTIEFDKMVVQPQEMTHIKIYISHSRVVRKEFLKKMRNKCLCQFPNIIIYMRIWLLLWKWAIHFHQQYLTMQIKGPVSLKMSSEFTYKHLSKSLAATRSTDSFNKSSFLLIAALCE
jgi:hypothetical protein